QCRTFCSRQEQPLFERQLCAGPGGVENLANFRRTGFERRQITSVHRGRRHFLCILPEETTRGATSADPSVSPAALVKMPDIRTPLRFQQWVLAYHNRKIDAFPPFSSRPGSGASGRSHAGPPSSAPNDAPLAAPALIH